MKDLVYYLSSCCMYCSSSLFVGLSPSRRLFHFPQISAWREVQYGWTELSDKIAAIPWTGSRKLNSYVLFSRSQVACNIFIQQVILSLLSTCPHGADCLVTCLALHIVWSLILRSSIPAVRHWNETVIFAFLNQDLIYMNTTYVYVCCSSLYTELDFYLNGTYKL